MCPTVLRRFPDALTFKTSRRPFLCSKQRDPLYSEDMLCVCVVYSDEERRSAYGSVANGSKSCLLSGEAKCHQTLYVHGGQQVADR